MSVCLVMIVKNESEVIARCLQSCKPLIDKFCIVDTGSTDGTQEKILEALQGKSGVIAPRPWKGFAWNRTEAMMLARDQRCDWLLVCDADSTFSGRIPRYLDKRISAYNIRYDSPWPYWQPLLVRSDLIVGYIGPVHEYLQIITPGEHVIENLDTLLITHHNDGHANQNAEAKFLEHHRLLQEHLKEHPDDARNTFYMAQTCKDLIPFLPELREQAIHWYRHRTSMLGWDEETFYAQFMLGILLCPVDFDQATSELLLAWEMRPSRAEPLFYLGHELRKRGYPNLAEHFLREAAAIPRPDDILFIHEEAYARLDVGTSGGTPRADPGGEPELPAVLPGAALATPAPNGHAMNVGHEPASSQAEAAA